MSELFFGLIFVVSIIFSVVLIIDFVGENITRHDCPDYVVEKCASNIHPNSCRQMYIYEGACREYKLKDLNG